MTCIYKEKSERNKFPFLILIVFMAVSFLIISNLVKKHIISANLGKLIDLALLGLFIYFILQVMKSIRTVIKYSLISGELIVRKKLEDKERLVDRVYLDSIKSVEPVRNLFLKIIMSFKDISFLFKKTYKITYDEDGEEKKIYLRPSEKFIEKLQNNLDSME